MLGFWYQTHPDRLTDYDCFFSTPEALSCEKMWKTGSRVWVAHKGAFALMDVKTNQCAFAGFTIACINTS